LIYSDIYIKNILTRILHYQFKTNHYEIIYYYFVVLGLATSSYSQDKQTKQDREEGLMKVEELPAVVIKRIGADFSVYIPDNHPDKDVRRLEENLLPTILVRTMKALKVIY
jgi:hypothetical protein